jgi:hypothetical protein
MSGGALVLLVNGPGDQTWWSVMQSGLENYLNCSCYFTGALTFTLLLIYTFVSIYISNKQEYWTF